MPSMNKKWGIFAYAALIIIFMLLSVDFYLSRKYYSPSSNEILINPALYSGKKFTFIGPVINTTSSSFYMSVNHKPLRVNYQNLQKPILGQIYVLATLNNDGSANALDVHDLSYNYVKYFISFFAFIIFLVIFFKEWKFKKWRLVENA